MVDGSFFLQIERTCCDVSRASMSLTPQWLMRCFWDFIHSWKIILTWICSRSKFEKHTAPWAYSKLATGAVYISNVSWSILVDLVVYMVWDHKSKLKSILKNGTTSTCFSNNLRCWMALFYLLGVIHSSRQTLPAQQVRTICRRNFYDRIAV